ncbi:hypothetical protein [Streptomyces sp. NBC_01176]|uniref:hypothetical protein n=1 Tax=Streptomyces sp. NBC_01176 TaxID=2903760 RepID=UPI00386DE3BC|nr:hypothetical protein OG199_26520 [Streptomyces sp. NBC_01176]
MAEPGPVDAVLLYALSFTAVAFFLTRAVATRRTGEGRRRRRDGTYARPTNARTTFGHPCES